MIIVIWSGEDKNRDDTPLVFCTLDEEKAKDTYTHWKADCLKPKERVDVMRVLPDGQIQRGRLEWVSTKDWLE